MTQSNKILGIIFPNMHEDSLSELTRLRTMASVPFGGRYRLIDFTLSAMVSAGVDNICMVVKRNYISLMDHVGSGKEWDLSRKIGGLKIFPPYGEAGSHKYKGKIEALESIKSFVQSSPCDTVILADCGIVSAIDYADVLQQHYKNEAQLTIIYKKEYLEACDRADNTTLELDGEKVTAVFVNDSTQKLSNVSMWTYIIDKQLLLAIIDNCVSRGLTNFERDVLQLGLPYMRVFGYEYKGYLRRMNSLQSFYNANLDLTNKESLDALFAAHPVYTKIRDDAPVRYAIGSRVNKIIAGDGCYIEGNVENSVLFRGVKVGKNSVVKNCILMQDTVVKDNVILENVICDKGVVITKDKKLIGAENHPVFIEKKARV